MVERCCRIWLNVIFMLLFLSSNFVLANQAGQLDVDGLAGPVQSVFEERLILSPEGEVNTCEAISETDFTMAGFASRITWYKNHQIYREKTNLYDLKNRLTATGNYQADGAFLPQSTYEYDALDHLRQMLILKPDGSIFIKRVLRYTPAGVLAEQLSFDSADNFEGRYRFSYNANGKQIASRCYDSNDTLISKAIYEYDTAGNLSQESIYGGATDKFPLKTIRYNAMGRKIAETNYTPGGIKIHEFLCEYNCAGNKMKQIHYRGDGTKYAETVYNERGLPTNYLNYKADGSEGYSEAYRYQYDTLGNWTEKTIAVCNGECKTQIAGPREVIRRTIHYY